MSSVFTKVFPVEAPYGFHITGYGTGYYLVPVKESYKYNKTPGNEGIYKSKELRRMLLIFIKRVIADFIVGKQTTRVDLVEIGDYLVSEFPFFSKDIYVQALTELSQARSLKNVDNQKSLNVAGMESFDDRMSLVVGKPQPRPVNYVLWEDKELLRAYAEDFRFLQKLTYGQMTNNELTEDLKDVFGIVYIGHVRIVREWELLLSLFWSKLYLSQEGLEEVSFTQFCSDSYKGLYAHYLDKLRNFYDEGEKGSVEHRDLLAYLSLQDFDAAPNGYGLQKVTNDQSREVYEEDLRRLYVRFTKADSRFVVLDLSHVLSVSSVIWDMENRYGLVVDYYSALRMELLCVNEKVEDLDYKLVASKVQEWLLELRANAIESDVTFKEFSKIQLGHRAVNKIIDQSDGLMKALGFDNEKSWISYKHITGVEGKLPDIMFTSNPHFNYKY
jgi:hypothetical protein